jgi:alpha-N-arabinofuranosidase
MGYCPKGFYKSSLFHAFSLFSNNSSGESIDALTLCNTYDTERFKNIPFLDVSVAYKTNEGELVINVVNRNEKEDINTSVISQTKNFGPNAEAFVLNGKSTNAYNTYEEQNVSTSTSNIKTNGNELIFTFPAHSLTMIKVKVL